MDLEYYPKGYDSFKVFLYKKVERISLALYLSTNHLADEVSLKTNIRLVADNLLKDILAFNRGQSNLNSTTKLKESFLEIRSLLNISTNCNLINQNNAHILIEEMSKISREIENQKDNFVGDSEFKKSFFVVESRHKVSEPVAINQPEIKSEIKNEDKGQKVFKGQEKTEESKDLEDRATKILQIIKDNEKVTIKDITSRISGYSEKTIQRELLRLVSLKVIKKEGERRWSTYSMI